MIWLQYIKCWPWINLFQMVLELKPIYKIVLSNFLSILSNRASNLLSTSVIFRFCVRSPSSLLENLLRWFRSWLNFSSCSSSFLSILLNLYGMLFQSKLLFISKKSFRVINTLLLFSAPFFERKIWFKFLVNPWEYSEMSLEDWRLL